MLRIMELHKKEEFSILDLKDAATPSLEKNQNNSVGINNNEYFIGSYSPILELKTGMNKLLQYKLLVDNVNFILKYQK